MSSYHTPRRCSTNNRRHSSLIAPTNFRDVLQGEGNYGKSEPFYTRRDDFARRAEDRNDRRGSGRTETALVGERRRRVWQDGALGHEARALSTTLIALRRERLRHRLLHDDYLIAQLRARREGKPLSTSLLPPLPAPRW